MVDKAQPFQNVWTRFKKWLLDNTHKDYVYFITCGQWDLKTMLPNQLKLSLTNIPACKHFINIKSEYAYFYNQEPRGLGSMLKGANLGFIGRQHSGIDDTKNMARLFEYMYDHGHRDFQVINL
jgi:ERI1 exoribonuclease 3